MKIWASCLPVANANLYCLILCHLLVDNCHVALFQLGNDAVIGVLLRDTADQLFAQLFQLRFREPAAFQAKLQRPAGIATEDSPHAIALDDDLLSRSFG